MIYILFVIFTLKKKSTMESFVFSLLMGIIAQLITILLIKIYKYTFLKCGANEHIRNRIFHTGDFRLVFQFFIYPSLTLNFYFFCPYSTLISKENSSVNPLLFCPITASTPEKVPRAPIKWLRQKTMKFCKIKPKKK